MGLATRETDFKYLAIGALSYSVVTILQRLADVLEGHMQSRSTAKGVILRVLLAGIAWKPHEGLQLSENP
jgi:hypothetical protein